MRHTIGSVSSGTMRTEDLIPAFMSELQSIADNISLLPTTATFEETEAAKAENARINGILADLEKRQEAEDYFESEEADYDLNELLFDELDNQAEPFFYFGSHEGDGADYGFWFSSDSFEEAVHEGSVIKVNAGDVWNCHDLADDVDYVAEITDHGNISLYNARTRAEVWAIV